MNSTETAKNEGKKTEEVIQLPPGITPEMLSDPAVKAQLAAMMSAAGVAPAEPVEGEEEDGLAGMMKQLAPLMSKLLLTFNALEASMKQIETSLALTNVKVQEVAHNIVHLHAEVGTCQVAQEARKPRK